MRTLHRQAVRLFPISSLSPPPSFPLVFFPPIDQFLPHQYSVSSTPVKGRVGESSRRRRSRRGGSAWVNSPSALILLSFFFLFHAFSIQPISVHNFFPKPLVPPMHRLAEKEAGLDGEDTLLPSPPPSFLFKAIFYFPSRRVPFLTRSRFGCLAAALMCAVERSVESFSSQGTCYPIHSTYPSDSPPSRFHSPV